VKSALDYKANPLKDKELGRPTKRIGMLFLNPSMRNPSQYANRRAETLAADAIVFNVDKEGWGPGVRKKRPIMSGNKVEHVKDAAPIMGNYFDILCIRTFPSLKNKEEDYSELYINQFCEIFREYPSLAWKAPPCTRWQSLTDIITITENQPPNGRRPKIVLSWAPPRKSAAPGRCQQLFPNGSTHGDRPTFVITHPEDYELDTTLHQRRQPSRMTRMMR